MRSLNLFLLLGIVLFSPVQADQQFYRCNMNGKTIYTDKPCNAPTLPGVIGPGASTSNQAAIPAGKLEKNIELDYTTPYGTWRGQVQYQAAVKGVAVQEAHAVLPLVIQVEKQGKVRGASPENGCKMLGVAAPHLAPNILTLDMTLSGCRYSAFNRRYSGTLALYQSSNSVQFSLQSFNMGLAAVGKGAAYFDIKATMRR